MQKVVNILEQHVQWIAIGLAVLFFGWIFYGNVITPPAFEPAGGRTLAAGEVDQYVYDNSAQAMETKVHSTGSLSVVVPDARQEIAAKLNPSPIPPHRLRLHTENLHTRKSRRATQKATQPHSQPAADRRSS